LKRIVYDLRIIGACLVVLYLVIFFTHLHYVLTAEFSLHRFLFAAAYAALAAGAIGVVLTKEWARLALVYVNIFLAVYIAIFPKEYVLETASLSNALMALVLALFFNQSETRARFVQKKGSAWRSILVVDDDETVIKIVRPILMSSGFSVLSASTGEEGLQIARQQRPDLIILDVIMPKMKGREVCQKLKDDAETQHIPVVFLTAKDSNDEIQAEMEAGAIAHLTKPVNAKELIETVSKILN